MDSSPQGRSSVEMSDYFIENKERFAFFVGLIGVVKLFDAAPASPFGYIFGFFMLSAATWIGWRLFRNCPKFEGIVPELGIFKFCMGFAIFALGSYIAWRYRTLARDLILPLIMFLIFDLFEKIDNKLAVREWLKRQGGLRWLEVLAISVWMLVIDLYASDWINLVFDAFPRHK